MLPLARQLRIAIWKQTNVANSISAISNAKPFSSACVVFSSSFVANTNADATGNLNVHIDVKNTFGLIAKAQGLEVFDIRHRDLASEHDIEVEPQSKKWKNTSRWYFFQCKKLAKQGKIKECVSMLERTMLIEDKVPPCEYNFSVVIGALGRQGQVKQAFELYYKLKSYGLTPSLACYTGLFNAVANSFNAKDMLSLRHLYLKLKDSNTRLNRISCNALLMAYAKHTTLDETIEVFQDTLKYGVEPDVITFNAIIRSCLKHKEDGFRMALQVWRQMLLLGVKPDGKIITSLLTVALECGLGDLQTASQLLLHAPDNSKEMKTFIKKHIRQFRWLKGQESHPNPDTIVMEESNPLLCITAPEDPVLLIHNDVQQQVQPLLNEKQELQTQLPTSTVLPNLLELPSDELKHVSSLSKCTNPWQRLQLMGGYTGVLDIMKKNKINHSVQVFTVLLRLSEPLHAEESALVATAEASRLKLDVDFYNTHMFRQAVRGDHKHALATFEKIKEHNLRPNYQSWCIHAKSCNNLKHAEEIFQQIEESNMKVNAFLLRSLVAAAVQHRLYKVKGYEGLRYPDFYYLVYLIKQLKKYGVKANIQIIHLFETVAFYPEKYNRWTCQDKEYERRINSFRKAYNEWLRTTDAS